MSVTIVHMRQFYGNLENTQQQYFMIADKSTTQGAIVSIVLGEWTEEVTIQMKDITHWKVQELNLNNNYRQKILKDIAHINFTVLTSLDLFLNGIQSIEELPRVSMPHLQKLNLSRNNITSVAVMRKATWPDLQSLDIYQNCFRDGNHLSEGCFPTMQKLYVHALWGDKNQHPQQYFTFKLQALSLQDLLINKNKFSLHRSAHAVLQQRWAHISIY